MKDSVKKLLLGALGGLALFILLISLTFALRALGFSRDTGAYIYGVLILLSGLYVLLTARGNERKFFVGKVIVVVAAIFLVLKYIGINF